MSSVMYAFNQVIPINFPEIEVEILEKFDAEIFHLSSDHLLAVKTLKKNLI